MSADDIRPILDAITQLQREVAAMGANILTLQTDVREYNCVKDRTLALEDALQAIEKNCARVQLEKESRKRPWIALAFTIMGGTILALIYWLIELIKAK